ncbi:MAG: hypothetical protein HGA47_10110 [Zoogloea sp.]|nr:hypothetical protein [Zoogloea sp.]
MRLAAWPVQSPFEDRKGRLVFIVDGLADADIDAIRLSLANLPTDAAALRISASTPLLPTKCWLAQRAPMAGANDIRLDGWIVQKKRLASR